MVEIVAKSDIAQGRSLSSPSTPSQPAISPGAKQIAPFSTPRLEIVQNSALGSFVYRLIDRDSGEMIRQWPTEQMVEMREYLAEQEIRLLDRRA